MTRKLGRHCGTFTLSASHYGGAEGEGEICGFPYQFTAGRETMPNGEVVLVVKAYSFPPKDVQELSE